LEWLLEKATEIGIDEITPVYCAHSERRVVKPARLEKVLLSATKQSLKAYLPRLQPMVPFTDFLKGAPSQAEKYIAYLGQGVKGSLKDNYRPGTDVCILVGPEGGFSPEEADAAIAKGFQPVSLGPSRLRTETAGLVAVHTIQLMNH
jgi:16S rRNA (uracil1498-N3)-methyltransferase